MPADIQSLPDELLSDILVRLPANHIHDVAQFVCLRWRRIVHSPDFVKTQIQRSTYGLILSGNQVGSRNHLVLITATQGGQIEKSFSYRCRFELHGTCNGLVMGRNVQDQLFYILNPATKREFVLPSCSRHQHALTCRGIAYAAASKEYKVIVPFRDILDSVGAQSLAILTVGVDESWRDVPVNHLSSVDGIVLVFCQQLTTEGSIHWANPRTGRVLTMDVESETFTTSTVPCPNDSYPGCSRFLSTGRTLSFLPQRGDLSWEVWELGSRDGEWSKALPDIELGGCSSRLVATRRLAPLGWVKYPEVLALGTGTGMVRTFVFFSLETREIEFPELPLFRRFSRLYCDVHKNNLAWYG